MSTLEKKKKKLDRALQQSKENLELSKKAVKVAEQMQKEVSYGIEKLFIADRLKEIWITLEGEHSIEKAIEIMESLNPLEMGQFRGTFLRIAPKISQDKNKDMEYTPYKLPYSLKVKPPYGSTWKDEFELYGFIQLGNYIVKVKINVVLPIDRLTRFIHIGSTGRSKVLRTVRNTEHEIPKPFTNYFVWSGYDGRSEMECYF